MAAIETIGTELPKEIKRNRRILQNYEEIGKPGNFGAAMIRRDLLIADAAIAGGDLIEMISAFKTLRDNKE